METLIASAVAYLFANYLTLIAIYIPGGALYAPIKWVIELRKLRTAVLRIDEPTEDHLRGWKSKEAYLQNKREHLAYDFFREYQYPPTAAKNKGLLTTWALFWPINLIWTLFADISKMIWNFLYGKFGSMLDAISKRMLPQ